MREQITEARAEQIIDRRVMACLSTDHAYRHAEDAEAQTAREEEITAEVETEVAREYAIYSQAAYFGRNNDPPYVKPDESTYSDAYSNLA
jgi:hypothetical protein